MYDDADFCGRARYAENRHNTTVMAKSRVQRALVFGVTPVLIWEYILMGRVLIWAPVTKTLMITSSNGPPRILRPGGVSREQIEELLALGDKPGEGRLFFDNLSRDAWLEARSRRPAGGQTGDEPLPVYRVLSPEGIFPKPQRTSSICSTTLTVWASAASGRRKSPVRAWDQAINDRLLKARST
jgi:hypothetical protein